eukprot:COSAG06_NODE_12716_length_1339_cov_2.558065_2_plen_312_part_00
MDKSTVFSPAPSQPAAQPCLPSSRLQKRVFSQLSLCLSRACLGKLVVFSIKMASQKTRFRTRRRVAQRSGDLVDALPIGVHVLKLSDACLQRRYREPSQPPDRLLLCLRQINLDKVELLARQLSLHVDALAKRRFRCVLCGRSPGGTPVVCLPLRSLGAERAHEQSQLVAFAPIRKRRLSQLSLCLSRSCLGKMIIFTITWRKKAAFSYLCSRQVGPCMGAVRNIQKQSCENTKARQSVHCCEDFTYCGGTNGTTGVAGARRRMRPAPSPPSPARAELWSASMSSSAKNASFFEFSLCLSRACLGKNIVLV